MRACALASAASLLDHASLMALRPAPRSAERVSHRLRFCALLVALGVSIVAFACGARTDLPAPDVGEGGRGPICSEDETAAYVASIGGGIHHVFKECFGRFDTTWCPSKEEALEFLEPTHCAQIDEVRCGPIPLPTACCYMVLEACAVT